MEIRYTEEELSKVVQDIILPILKEKKILTFTGPLGAGKTTLIKEIFKQCGITEVVTSPTFGYVKSYKKDDGVMFHHFDLYRIDSIESFIHEGLDEYFYQENVVCFVEWPELIDDLLKSPELLEKTCDIVLFYEKNDLSSRRLSFKA